MTEITLKISVYSAGHLMSISSLSTFDLSAPERIINNLASKYNTCTIEVVDSRGKKWVKKFGE